jgi:2-oxoglutarate ferredoxin oxidoreductase subunit alpha
MNPAALMANIEDLPRGADIIANTDEFTKRNLVKVGYDANPLEDGSLDGYQLHAIPITSVTVKALEGYDISKKDAERAKNMFSLGMLCWLYNRPADGTLRFLEAKFASKPEIMKANIAAFQAGWNYGETTEEFSVQYEIKPATLPPGQYRNITGEHRTGHRPAAGPLSGLPMFLGSHRSRHPTSCTSCPPEAVRIRTFQAEDEISGVGAAPGAAASRGALRGHDHVGSWHVPDGRDGLAGRRGRAAAGGLRHPAPGRYRHADQDRKQADSADGAVYGTASRARRAAPATPGDASPPRSRRPGSR